MMTARIFPTPVILSFLTGTLGVPSDMGGLDAVYAFIQFFESYKLGASCYSGRGSDYMRSKIREEFRRRYPAFASVTPDGVDESNWRLRFALWQREIGDTFAVTPLTLEEAHTCFTS
jgi:hypothetical protein